MIQVSNVGLRYGDRKLFDDVNIKFTMNWIMKFIRGLSLILKDS